MVGERAGGSPAAVLLRPTFGAATEVAFGPSDALVRELETVGEERNKLRSEVRKLERAVAEQQQVIEALEDRDSYEKMHAEWQQVVQEIEGQNRFIATLQALVEKQERQLLDSKGLAAKLAAANNELAAFEKQMTGLRQEGRAYAVRTEKDLQNTRAMFEERLAEQKRELELMHLAEKDRSLAQHEAEKSAQAAQFRVELEKFQKEADASLKSAQDAEQKLWGELQTCQGELEDSSSELRTASDMLKRLSDELIEKTARQEAGATKLAKMEEDLHLSEMTKLSNKEESEKALRMMHDSLTVLNARYEERGSTIEELQHENHKLKQQAETLEKSVSSLTAALKASRQEQSKTHELVQSNDKLASDKTQMITGMEETLRKLLSERENMEKERDFAENQFRQIEHQMLQGEGEVSSEKTQMEESLREMRTEKESMKNERDLAQKQLKQMQNQMRQVAEDRTSQAGLIRETLESQLAVMQEEFRMDMANLHEENRRQMSEQQEKTRKKIRALEQSTDDLQKDREELMEQLEVAVNETYTDEHMVRLSADNRALRLQVQELQADIQLCSAPESIDESDAVCKQRGAAELIGSMQMDELEEVVVAQNKELKNVLKRIQDLQDEKHKMTDAYEEMEQTEKTWQRHALEWGKEADTLKERIKQLEEALGAKDAHPFDTCPTGCLKDTALELDYGSVRDALDLRSMVRVGMEELGEFEDVKSQIESYVAEIADSKPKQEVFTSFSLLLFRMATTEAHLEQSIEAEAASARGHAQLSQDVSMLKASAEAREATLSDAMSRIERLKQENASLQLSIVTLEDAKASAEAREATLSDAITDEAPSAELASRVKELMADKEESQAEQRELYKQLHQFRERAEHLEADLARLQQEFESARQAHSAMEALKISLEQSEQVNGALHESLRNLTQETGELLKAKNQQAQDHQATQEALEVKLKETSERLAAELKKQQTLDQQLVAEVEQRKILDQQISAALMTHTELKAQVTAEVAANKHLQGQVSTMESWCKALEAQIAGETKTRNALQQQVEESKTDCRQKENFFQHQSAEYEAVIAELKDVLEQSQRRTHAEITELKEQTQAEITALKKHKDETEAEIGTLEDELRALREDKSSWSVRLTELAQQKQEAQDQLQGLRQQFSDVKVKQQASEGTVAELKHLLSSREQSQKRLEKQIANSSDTREYLDQLLKQSEDKDKTLAKYQQAAVLQTMQVNFMLDELQASKILELQLERALSLLDVREEELLRSQMEVELARDTLKKNASNSSV